jgi:hypothetical protein
MMAILNKRPETYEQRRVRDLLADDRAEHLIPPEVLAQGDFADVTVVADDRSQATTKRRKSSSGLVRMYENGKLDDEQFKAAMKITRVMESIGRDVGVRMPTFEARVDNSSGNKNDLLESVGRARDEVTYNKWRARLPIPKRMVLDMISVDRPLAATARIYKMSWAKARMTLVDALDLWTQLRDDAERLVDEDDIKAVLYRILTLENGKGS